MLQQNYNSALTAVLADMKSGETNSKRRYNRHKADNLILCVAKSRNPGEMPPSVTFFPVRCRDLSCGGVSFFLPARPSFQRLVVLLGDRSNGFYMEATVRHVSTAIELPKEKSAWDSNGRQYDLELGAKPFQVGCQFLKRLAVPTQ